MDLISLNKDYYKALTLMCFECILERLSFYYDWRNDDLRNDDLDYVNSKIEFYTNALFSFGHVFYHTFKDDFENIWKRYMHDLPIPNDITSTFICSECSEGID